MRVICVIDRRASPFLYLLYECRGTFVLWWTKSIAVNEIFSGNLILLWKRWNVDSLMVVAVWVVLFLTEPVVMAPVYRLNKVHVDHWWLFPRLCKFLRRSTRKYLIKTRLDHCEFTKSSNSGRPIMAQHQQSTAPSITDAVNILIGNQVNACTIARSNALSKIWISDWY